MNLALWIALIGAISATLSSIASLIVAIKAVNKVENIHLAINSRFDEWMKMARKASYEEGVKSEVDRVKTN